MEIESIRNYLQISERMASSGQPEESEFNYIAKAGYQVIINLAMPNSDFSIPEEGYIVSVLKMTYVHIAVPFDAPEISHLKEFIKLLHVYESKKIWIHCALNYRVSAFLYLYKTVIQSESPQQAMSVMLPSWQPNSVWQAFMAIPREHILNDQPC